MKKILFLVILIQAQTVPALAFKGPRGTPPASSGAEEPDPNAKKADPNCENAAAQAPAKLNMNEMAAVGAVVGFLKALHRSHTEGGNGMNPSLQPLLAMMPTEIQPELMELTLQMPEGLMKAGLNRTTADRRAFVILKGLKAFYNQFPKGELWFSEKLQEIFRTYVPAKSFYELAFQQLTVFSMAPTQDDALHLAAFLRIGTEALGLEMQNSDLGLDLFGLAERMQFLLAENIQPRAFMLSMAAIGDPVFFDEAKENVRNLCSAKDDDELLARAARNECGWSEEEPLLQGLYNFQSTRPEIVKFRDRFKAAVKKGNEDLDHYLELLARKPLL